MKWTEGIVDVHYRSLSIACLVSNLDSFFCGRQEDGREKDGNADANKSEVWYDRKSAHCVE